MPRFDFIGIRGMRKAHFEQLLFYLNRRIDPHSQWYYGNKAEFDKRHEELKNWLELTIEYLDTGKASIPRR